MAIAVLVGIAVGDCGSPDSTTLEFLVVDVDTRVNDICFY